MNRMMCPRLIGAATLALLAQAVPAEAAAFRTWVASNGNDSNPCSRAQPCATFPGAQAKTDAGGEINCVDAGDFGGINISKPLTIDCAGTLAAISAGLVNVDVPEASFPNGVVRLRNLTINMGGAAKNGIRIRGGGAQVHIENCSITGVPQGFEALLFSPQSSLDLFIRDTFIGGNAGVALAFQSGPSVFGRVSLDNVRLDHNGAGISILKSGAGTAVVILEDVQIENSPGGAIGASGAGAVAVVSNSTVTLNFVAFSALNSGQIFSLGNNTVAGNSNLGSTPTQLAQQ